LIFLKNTKQDENDGSNAVVFFGAKCRPQKKMLPKRARSKRIFIWITRF